MVAATDGETFGHHHDGADEVVGRAWPIAEPAYGVRVPRLVDLLDESPPATEVRVRTSAWSCAHGVQRWMADCGCHTGGAEGWNQALAGPAPRTPSTSSATGAIEVFERRGRSCSATRGRPATTTSACSSAPCGWDEFAGRHIVGDGHQAGVLLDAQRNALLMYTSCGWFFNDLAGIETIQVLRYAARSIDLLPSSSARSRRSTPSSRSSPRPAPTTPTQGTGRDLWSPRSSRAEPRPDLRRRRLRRQRRGRCRDPRERR